MVLAIRQAFALSLSKQNQKQNFSLGMSALAIAQELGSELFTKK